MEVSTAATVPPPPVAAITEPLVEVQQEVETTTSTPPPPESPAQSKEASDAAEVQPLPTEDEQTPSALPPAAESQSPPAEATCKVRHCIDIHVRGLRRFVSWSFSVGQYSEVRYAAVKTSISRSSRCAVEITAEAIAAIRSTTSDNNYLRIVVVTIVSYCSW